MALDCFVKGALLPGCVVWCWFVYGGIITPWLFIMNLFSYVFISLVLNADGSFLLDVALIFCAFCPLLV